MKRGWSNSEEEFLQNNYNTMTIKELQKAIELIEGRKRSSDSINAKIKRSKDEGWIKGGKEEGVTERALIQRRKKI
jgi:hypothetical protein